MSTAKSLKPAVFHILLALADRESHGYAIMQSVREQSGGRVPLQTGSFYRHLSKLIDQALVEEAPEPPQVEDARRGSHYRLTARGRKVLKQESRHLASLVVRLRELRLAPREDTP